MKKKISLLWELFLHFAKIGCFTFGGGYAMIAIISDTCVNQKKWIDHEEMMNLTVIAESTPGPIAINCATYVGYKMAGFVGAVVTTVGIVLPAFCIIYAISSYLDNFLEYALIAKAFQGIKVGVGVVILDAGFKMLKKMPKKPLPRIIVGCAFGAMLLSDIFAMQISSITLMLVAAVVSLSIYLVKGGAAK